MGQLPKPPKTIRPPREPRAPTLYYTLPCGGCGTPVIRRESELLKCKHGKPYCSKPCRMRHYNANVLEPTSCNRSRAEDVLIEIVRRDYPLLEIRTNDRDTLSSRLEIDILLPTLGTAIELNGPVHYLPIFGDERLRYIQDKDLRKQIEIHEAGLRLIIIDISHLQTRKRTRAFLEEYYVSHIRPILVEAGAGVPPTIGSVEMTSTPDALSHGL